MRQAFLALAALLLIAGPSNAQPRALPPIDQCSSSPGFIKFRSGLRQAVAKKDRESFLAMVAPDVLVNFGGDSGRDAFTREWSFDPGEHGNVWHQLDRMMKMGCARDRGARVIPSLIMQLEPNSVADWIIILPGAKLYKETGVESTNPQTVPWTVAVVTSRAGDLVTGVRLPDGRDGYVSDDDLYEPLGYRMIIETRGGKWMITAFVAGD